MSFASAIFNYCHATLLRNPLSFRSPTSTTRLSRVKDGSSRALTEMTKVNARYFLVLFDGVLRSTQTLQNWVKEVKYWHRLKYEQYVFLNKAHGSDKVLGIRMSSSFKAFPIELAPTYSLYFKMVSSCTCL